MLLKAPSRTYTPESLKFWGKYLLNDWESHFSPLALKDGRKIYKNRAVKSLDIQVKSLGVQLRETERKVLLVYAIFEQDLHDLWSIRGSVDDEAFNQSLVVAGLYELEEFLAESVDDLLSESVESKIDLKKKPEVKPLISEYKVKSQLLPNPVRTIKLNFTVQGSVFYFQLQLKNDLKNLSLDEVLKYPQAREDAIRLLHWLKKAGFVYQGQGKKYVFQYTLTEARLFITKTLPLWERYYELHLSDEALALIKGVKVVKCVSYVEKTIEGIRFRPRLFLGDQFLEDGILKQLLKSGGEGIIKGYGWLNTSEHFKASLGDDTTVLGLFDEVLPNYMLYAILHQKFDSCIMTAEVQKLKKALEEREFNHHEALPSFLRGYQSQGVEWMRRVLNAGGHPLLADEMGLGKTLQILSLLHGERQKGLCLVVCPASVVSVWQQEVMHFFPEWPVQVLTKNSVFDASKTGILWIASYTQLRRHRALLNQVSFLYAIIDEAQMIKNPQSKTAQAAYAIHAQYRLALTGTPIENKHLDLWSVFRFLMPGLLGSKAFFERFLKKPEAINLLKKQIQVFVLRRLKSAVLQELPEKTYMVLPCELTPLQRDLYAQHTGELLKSYPDGFLNTHRLSILTGLMRLRQIACDPGLLELHKNIDFEYSGKLMVLYERVTELIDNGEKVVIFSQFVSFLNRVQGLILKNMDDFGKIPVFMLTGQTKNRAEVIHDFQTHHGPAIILASLKAAGAGITLHAASYVFLLDPWWNPAVEAQAIDRVHRFGQKKPVFVYRLVATETLENKIELLKQYKQGIFNDVLDELPDLTRLEQHFDSLKHLIALQ